MSRIGKAATFPGNGTITMAERSYPDPGDGQLLIRVGANAICGTDREQYYNGSEVIPGHEAAGVVEAAGSGTHTPAGTRGAIYLMDYCGQCRSCRLGSTNQCLAKRADTGFTTDGGYGPYELIHETQFFPVPADLPAVDTTLLLDVMGTSGHAIRRAQLVREDIESVYIGGAGPIGLGLLVVASLTLGSEVPIYVSDVSDWRLDHAHKLGGIPVDVRRPDAAQAVPPVDVAFDSTGKTDARHAALGVLDQRGVLVCVGHGENLTLDVSNDLIAPERAVLGSEYFRYDEMPANLQLLLEHREQLRRVITHTFPVADITEAFETFLSGQAGKVIVTQDQP